MWCPPGTPIMGLPVAELGRTRPNSLERNQNEVHFRRGRIRPSGESNDHVFAILLDPQNAFGRETVAFCAAGPRHAFNLAVESTGLCGRPGAGGFGAECKTSGAYSNSPVVA